LTLIEVAKKYIDQKENNRRWRKACGLHDGNEVNPGMEEKYNE